MIDNGNGYSVEKKVL